MQVFSWSCKGLTPSVWKLIHWQKVRKKQPIGCSSPWGGCFNHVKLSKIFGALFEGWLKWYCGRWKPDLSCICDKNYSPSPRGVICVLRFKCRTQIQRFLALSCTHINSICKNSHFEGPFRQFLLFFEGNTLS